MAYKYTSDPLIPTTQEYYDFTVQAKRFFPGGGALNSAMSIFEQLGDRDLAAMPKSQIVGIFNGNPAARNYIDWYLKQNGDTTAAGALNALRGYYVQKPILQEPQQTIAETTAPTQQKQPTPKQQNTKQPVQQQEEYTPIFDRNFAQQDLMNRHDTTIPINSVAGIQMGNATGGTSMSYSTRPDMNYLTYVQH